MSERDMLSWAMLIAAAEEAARQKVSVEVEAPPVREVKPQVTYVVDRRNVVLKGEETIVQKRGCGVLQEFMVKAEDMDFHVFVERDGEPVVYGSYSRYAEVSQDVKEIDAYPERDQDGELTGAYVLRVTDIEFADGLTVKVSTPRPIKFRAIFCKYKLCEA